MSYILDALQKSAKEAEPAEPTVKFPGAVGPAQKSAGGLSLPWKLAIGAILVANVALVFLWRADRTEKPAVAQMQNHTDANNTDNIPQPTLSGRPSGSTGKITLPGILSPRNVPPPRVANTQTATPNTGTASSGTMASGTMASGTIAAGTGRTFRPTGRKITITGEPDPEDLDYRTSNPTTGQAAELSTTPKAAAPRPTTSRVIPQPEAIAGPSKRARNASALSSLSNSERNILHALSFSFHIFGAESDLRSVGVNGQRITEGDSVTADNGKTFIISEITDSGAIIEFEHEGENVSVAIPVMEDWKDS